MLGKYVNGYEIVACAYTKDSGIAIIGYSPIAVHPYVAAVLGDDRTWWHQGHYFVAYDQAWDKFRELTAK